MQYIDFLRRVPLFAELDEDELEHMSSVIREHHYRKNVTIFHIDDPGNAMFIIKDGLVKVTIEDEAGREMILRMLYSTDFFGDMALIDGLPRSCVCGTQPGDLDALPGWVRNCAARVVTHGRRRAGRSTLARPQ